MVWMLSLRYFIHLTAVGLGLFVLFCTLLFMLLCFFIFLSQFIYSCVLSSVFYTINVNDFLLVGHCKYSSVLYHFRVIRRWLIVTLKSEGHWRSSKLVPFEFGFLFAFHSIYGSILHHFRNKARLVENRDFLYPLAFDAPVTGSPSEYCHLVWCGKTRMIGLHPMVK